MPRTSKADIIDPVLATKSYLLLTPRLAGYLLFGSLLVVSCERVYPAEYVGRQNCVPCHEAQNESWVGSHHDLAMQEANGANFGGLLGRLQNLREAEAAYKKAIDIDRNFVPAYINLADLYRAQNRDVEGKKLLLKAIKLRPDNGSLRHAYGLLLVREKRLTVALDSLRKAIDLAPNNTRYAYVYAVALESAGRLTDALQILDAAHARRSADRNVLYMPSYHSTNVQVAWRPRESLPRH